VRLPQDPALDQEDQNAMTTESVSSAQAFKIVRSELLELRSDDFPALKMEMLSTHIILFAG